MWCAVCAVCESLGAHARVGCQRALPCVVRILVDQSRGTRSLRDGWWLGQRVAHGARVPRRARVCAGGALAAVRGMAWRGVACRSRAPWIRVIPRLAMCVAMSLGASAHWLAARCAGACSDACSDACSGVWAALRGADSRLSVAHFICVVVGGCQLCVWRVSHREPAGWRRAVLRCAAWNNTTRHGTASTSKAPGICVPRCGSGRAVRVGGPCGSCPSSRVLCCAVPPCPLSCVLGMPARAAWARHAAGACGCEWCACCVWLEGGARAHACLLVACCPGVLCCDAWCSQHGQGTQPVHVGVRGVCW